MGGTYSAKSGPFYKPFRGALSRGTTCAIIGPSPVELCGCILVAPPWLSDVLPASYYRALSTTISF